jgi:TonB-linked SusC/RagA family outer membrane protein
MMYKNCKKRLFRLLWLAILLFGIQAGVQAQDGKIVLSVNDVTIREFFGKIEEQSEYRFTYRDQLINEKRTISYSTKGESIESLLYRVLTPLDLQFKISHKNILITQKTVKSPDIPNKAYSGVVKDESGEPVIGASVKVKNAALGSITDTNGKFSIEAVSGSTLVISYMGYVPKEIKLGHNSADLHVVLQEDAKLLNEVVVVGYGSMRKSDFTGSLANIKASELSLSAPTIGQALVGKVAGVQVTTPNGAPGSGAKIRIRGVSSLSASSAPLIVVDGYPALGIGDINPDDIESVDVLKDAASAAIYGSRGASGVILVTTKRGKTGKARIDYDYQYSVSQLAKKVKVLDAWQFRDLVIEARNNSYRDRAEGKGLVWGVDAGPLDDNETRIKKGFKVNEVGIAPIFFDFKAGQPVEPANNTDWQDAIYGNAPMHRHNISVVGGNEKLSYRFSAGYLNQDGIMDPSGHERINVRTNVDAQVTKRFRTGINFSFSSINERPVPAGGRFSDATNPGIVQTALVMYPQMAVYNADGSYAVGQQIALAGDGYAQAENPVALAHLIELRYREHRMTFNTNLSFDILKQLTINANIGTQYTISRNNTYRPRTIGSGTNMPNSAGAIASVRATDITNYNVDALGEFTLKYKESFGAHSIDAIAGYTMQKRTYDRVGVVAKGMPNDLIHEITAHGSTPGDVDLNSDDTRKAAWSMLSYLGRVNYSYQNRYALSVTARTDGSSRFGPKNKWGWFPSVSAGWTVSNEKFWTDRSSALKLRASWGLSGNNDIGNYEAYATMSQGGYPFGGSVEAAYWQAAFSDAAIGWEKTSQYNLGVDYSLFNNRLSLIANYYDSNSYNLLYNQPISAVSGSTSVTTNLDAAKVINRGIDLQADARILTGDFKWNVSANLSVNRNKVADMGGLEDIYMSPERSVVCYVTRSGLPIGSFYGYKVIGVVHETDMPDILADKQVWKENGNKLPDGYTLKGPAVVDYNNIHAGDALWQDTDHDGIISSDDRDILGDAFPDFTYGFSMDFSYGNFDLRSTFTGSQGGEVINFSKYYVFGLEGYGNQLVSTLNRYHSDAAPGKNNIHRAARHSTPNISTRLSSYFVEDASYFRCANITLGYNLPQNKLRRLLGIQALRLYASVDNLFTITGYEGYNPDVDYKGNNLMPGFDWGVYPLSRTYSVGVKVSF